MLGKNTKHGQSKFLVNLDDLFSCLDEVETVDFVIGWDNTCKKVVKISVENLQAQLEDIA